MCKGASYAIFVEQDFGGRNQERNGVAAIHAINPMIVNKSSTLVQNQNKE